MGAGHNHILITGTFCSFNKGDAAMRIALTDELKQAIPSCHITMMSPFPELDKNAYKSDVLLQCSRRKPFKVLELLIRSAIWRGIWTVFRIDASFILNKELRTYKQSDLVVDLSGDGLTEEYGIKCLIAHLVPIILGKLLDRPVFVCAQTIGPLYKTQKLCRWILRKADAITARESLTLNYLNGIGLNGTHLSLTADMAFLVKPAPPDAAKSILLQEGVTFEKPLVGLSISRLPGHILGLNYDSKKVSSFEQEIAETLDRLVEAGFKPVIISHTVGPGERRDDRKAAERVATLSHHSADISVLKGDYSVEELKGIIGEMDLFVGVRMHSCISAISMSVPTISIAYGPKAFGIMRSAGQEQWVMDIRQVTADNLTDRIQELWQNRQSVQKTIQSEMMRVYALARQNVNIIRQMLNIAG
ncbi:MAG TPA: polysaccharide pyruvyl transferase family protein [Armatimonadota bacterium]|mgnify:FL=1|nr:polysaccharide pyruvyl transferase family protein [Armatimonadota bacterium]